MNTRSLSVAKTEIYNHSELAMAQQVLLYYENSTGGLSALFQETGLDQGIENFRDHWVDITSQESKSLPDGFRNSPNSTAEGYSKTFYESLVTNSFTLSASFTCQSGSGNRDIGAMFYSPNVSNFRFQSNDYSTCVGGAGTFNRSIHFAFLYPVVMYIS